MKTFEFTSLATVTALGLSLAIVRVGGMYELQISRGGDMRTESYETREQARERAGAMMGRVAS